MKNEGLQYELELLKIIGNDHRQAIPNFSLTKEELVRLADYWAKRLADDEFFIRNPFGSCGRSDLARRDDSAERLAYFDQFLGHDTVERIWKHHEAKLLCDLDDTRAGADAELQKQPTGTEAQEISF